MPSWIASGLDGPEVANDTGQNPSSPLKVAAESCFWTTKDQSRFGGGLNFYAYANNDPVNWIDVNGKNPILIAVGIGVVLGMGMSAPSDTAGAPADILGMSLSALGLGGLGTGGAAARVGLYRAVGPAELADIEATNAFRGIGNGAGRKYFSTTRQGASQYAKMACKSFGDPPYTVVRSSLPRTSFEELARITVDQGIPTVVFPE